MVRENLEKFFHFVLVAGFVAFLILWYKEPSAKPLAVLTPEVYAKGTKVEIYQEEAPGFPDLVIMANKGLNYSGIVKTPGGQKQWTVSYISEENISVISNAYAKHLGDLGWDVRVAGTSEQAASFVAKKGLENLIITIASLPNSGGLMVTLQYERG